MKEIPPPASRGAGALSWLQPGLGDTREPETAEKPSSVVKPTRSTWLVAACAGLGVSFSQGERLALLLLPWLQCCSDPLELEIQQHSVV